MNDEQTRTRFETLLRPLMNDAYNLTRWLMKKQQDAEDMVQEFYLRAFRCKKATVEAVREAIAALPLDFREVIVLRELEGLSYKEISEVIGVPLGTVMSRLARGRHQLYLMLSDRKQHDQI